MRKATPLAIFILVGLAPAASAEEPSDQNVDVSALDPHAVLEAINERPPTPLCNVDPINPMEGFSELDPMAYIDAPDADAVRATAPIENWLAGRLSREEVPSPLTKSYCQIGITNMVTDYHHAVENDDALIGIAYRAVYSWNTEAEFPGWQLIGLGERVECARGRDIETDLCR